MFCELTSLLNRTNQLFSILNLFPQFSTDFDMIHYFVFFSFSALEAIDSWKIHYPNNLLSKWVQIICKLN